MSERSQNTSDNQEIDLTQISNNISSFFEGVSAKIFRGILFIKRNLVLLFLLFIIGAVGGYFLDRTSNSFQHEVIVAPNFGSADYLYDKIDLIESKINQNDTVFLKSIGIKKPKSLTKIEIEPVIDIYNFVNSNTTNVNNAQNTQNFELVKLLSEDGDINKVIKDKTTSKNYGRHTIRLSTKGMITNQNMIEPILAYLNKNDYYQNLQKVYLINIKIKMEQNEGIINQINGLLNGFSSSTNSNQKSDKLVYYNDNTQINDIIKTKNDLVNELGGQRLNLIDYNQIIKTHGSVINVKIEKGINGKMKQILPFLLVFCFIALSTFISFYKKQAAKLKLK